MSGRIVGAKKRHYRIEGSVEIVGDIREYCWATSERQATWLIARRLEARFPHLRIYIGACTVTDITGEKQWKG